MIPALVQWEVTERCNYLCLHCYRTEEAGSNARPQELPDEAMWHVAETLVANRLFFVTFTGGEPLLRKRLVVELSRYLAEHGLRLSLNTNLALLDERTLSDLRVHRLLISCPSAVADQYAEITVTGSYERFVDRLRMVIAAKVDHTVNMVVHRMNRNTVRTTARQMAALGVRHFAATPVSLNARSPRFDLTLSFDEVQETLADLIWAHEELGLGVDVMEALPKCAIPQRAFELNLPFVYRSCHAGRRNGTISPTGDIRPCGHNPQVFGNILKEPVASVWGRMQNWRDLSGNQHVNCMACDLFSSCGGGCRIDAAVVTGRTNGAHPYMIEPAGTIVPTPPLPQFTAQTVVQPSRSFQSRPEGDGWLVAPGSSRNILEVNDTLYGFLVGTRSLAPMTLKALAEQYGTIFEDTSFRDVMTTLTQKSFFVVGSGER